MGCFDGTCNLTGVSIGAGDPVFVLVVNKEYLYGDGTYQLNQALWRNVLGPDEKREYIEGGLKDLLKESFDYSTGEFIKHSALNQKDAADVWNQIICGQDPKEAFAAITGKQLDPTREDFINIFRKDLIRYVGVGTYNDYGWIEEDPAYKTENTVMIMVHLFAAQRATSHMNLGKDSSLGELLLVARDLAHFAYKTRTQIIDPIGLLGGQHFDEEEYKDQTLKQNITAVLLDNKIAEYRKNAEEYDY